jgi:uncharacterized protein (DUF2235 family)
MKRIIVCCDGTWDKPVQSFRGRDSSSNVWHFARRIAKSDGERPQIVWYDQGVGTGDLEDVIRGGISGYGLEQNILEAYRFLVSNYELGDELFLVGFSRGAYTVRSLAGMIRKCGIIRQDNSPNYGAAMKLYQNAEHPDEPGPTQFRERYSVAGAGSIPIWFLGVWDTVGARGIPVRFLSELTQRKYRFHDTELSGSVRNAYHALAIDERRWSFEPTLWTSNPKSGQTVEQRWFCGTHSDVGGGPASNGLPDVSLGWMLEKAEQAGLAFDQAVLRANPLHPQPTARLDSLERTALWGVLTFYNRRLGLKTIKNEDGTMSVVNDVTQTLDPSVRTRWDQLASYRPSNLFEYFERINDPRADSARPSLLGTLFGRA